MSTDNCVDALEQLQASSNVYQRPPKEPPVFETYADWCKKCIRSFPFPGSFSDLDDMQSVSKEALNVWFNGVHATVELAITVFTQLIAPRLNTIERGLCFDQYLISEQVLGLLILLKGAFICCYGRPESDCDLLETALGNLFSDSQTWWLLRGALERCNRGSYPRKIPLNKRHIFDVFCVVVGSERFPEDTCPAFRAICGSDPDLCADDRETCINTFLSALGPVWRSELIRAFPNYSCNPKVASGRGWCLDLPDEAWNNTVFSQMLADVDDAMDVDPETLSGLTDMFSRL